MEPILTSQELRSLGIAGLVPGPLLALMPPEADEVALGAVAEAPIELEDCKTLAASEPLPEGKVSMPGNNPLAGYDIDFAALKEAGFKLSRLKRNPSILKVESDHRGLRAFPPEAADRVVFIEGGMVFLDPTKVSAPVAIVHPESRTGFALRPPVFLPDEDRPREVIGPLFPEIPVSPVPVLSSPARGWCSALKDSDAWLADQAEEFLARNDPFEHVVAIGLIARLKPAPRKDALATAVNDLLAGTADLADEPERVWARGLAAEPMGYLEDAAIAATSALLRDLAALEDAVLGPDDRHVPDPRWPAEATRILHRRDDLEGVRLILAEAGCGARLAPALAALDSAGELLFAALPSWPGSEADERLRRALSVSPEGWWTRAAEAS